MIHYINKILIEAKFTQIGFLAFFFILISACSTQKDEFMNRTYHTTTTRYNYYYNGNESLKEGIKALANSHKNDYNAVIEIFPYGREEDAQSVSPQMDLAIKKASNSINRHSMMIRNKERNNWMDETYLMMGKAYFFKRDFIGANQNFDFVASRFSRNRIKYDAVLWKIKGNNLQEKFKDSESLLGMLESQIKRGNVSKHVKKEFPLVYADYYLKQENYKPAIPLLLKGISLNRKKTIRYRLTYILAQIYQLEGELDKASKYYRKTIKLNPPYEMTFNAMINSARCYDGEGGGRSIVKLLNKMAKDTKNKEYLDQIYYALAEIAIKDGDMAKAKENLILSSAKSQGNNNQKAISCLKLADIYFTEKTFKQAQFYYDSTLMFLEKTYPDYIDISEKTEVLTELVNHLVVIEHEDSLQYVAKLSKVEQQEIIDGIIKEIEEKEAAEKAKAESSGGMYQQFDEFGAKSKMAGNTESGGGNQWYFYNPSLKSYGFSEFKKKWGTRKQEDLWRLTNKQSVDAGMSEGMEVGVEGNDSLSNDSVKKEVATADPKDPKSYYDNLPTTEEKLKISNENISNAMYGAGLIYRSSLNDLDASILSFEGLENRYPEYEIVAAAYYQLFLIYKGLGFTDKAEKYKNLLVQKYPDKEYSKMASDPDYFKKISEQKDKVEQLYAQTYAAYQNKDAKRVIKNTAIAIAKYDDPQYMAKFKFLKVLATSSEMKSDTLVKKLKNLISAYPDADIKPNIQALVKALTEPFDPIKEAAELAKKDSIQTAKPPYNFDASSIHLFIAVAEVKTANVSQIKNGFSDFNTKYFSLDKLTVSSMYLDNVRQLITVTNFSSEKGINYYNTFSNNPEIKNLINSNGISYFLISVDNYATFYKRKNIAEYESFFLENYFK